MSVVFSSAGSLRPVSLLALALGLTLAEACAQGVQEGSRSHRTDSEQAEVVLDQTDHVVATVDGVPITASRVEALVQATGRPPREVVERLIDFELLAAEAHRRGLGRGAEVRFATRQALVQRYLERDYEPTHRPEDLTEATLRSSYEQNLHRFVRPRLYKVAHVLVWSSEREDSPARRAGALKLAREIWSEARKVADTEEFLALGPRYDTKRGYKVTSEVLSTTVHPKASLQASFVKATLALGAPGELSEPVSTTFGSHVIYVDDLLEEKNESFEKVREEVRKNEHPFWIKQSFYDLTERLRKSTPVTGFLGSTKREDGS